MLSVEHARASHGFTAFLLAVHAIALGAVFVANLMLGLQLLLAVLVGLSFAWAQCYHNYKCLPMSLRQLHFDGKKWQLTYRSGRVRTARLCRHSYVSSNGLLPYFQTSASHWRRVTVSLAKSSVAQSQYHALLLRLRCDPALFK